MFADVPEDYGALILYWVRQSKKRGSCVITIYVGIYLGQNKRDAVCGKPLDQENLK
jgi:hypothetical protein